MGYIGTKPSAVPLTSADITDGIITVADIASGTGGLVAWQSVQTTGFTAVKGRGYPCNTTSAAFTVTLPASPSVGDTIILLDYAGTFATNNITLGANGNKIEGGTGNKLLTTNREAVTLTYVDSTQGWVASSGANEGTGSIDPTTYSVDFLVIAGGGGGGGGQDDGYGGGGGGAGGYRNSYLTETSGGGGSSEASLTFDKGIVYTITVGAGGAGGTNASGVVGVDSSISGTGITTLTSSGGGFGKGGTGGTGGNGGSGGGANSSAGGGSGTANQGFNGGIGSPGQGVGGGGGGAGAVGVDIDSATPGPGGAGLASSITGSSITRAGGGGGGSQNLGANGGSGGGGNGASSSGTATVGTINTGSGGGAEGGGAASSGNHGVGRAGGKGVVILRMPTNKYSGTTTGSPTVTTDGSDKVIVFNDSGSITG